MGCLNSEQLHRRTFHLNGFPPSVNIVIYFLKSLRELEELDLSSVLGWGCLSSPHAETTTVTCVLFHRKLLTTQLFSLQHSV